MKIKCHHEIASNACKEAPDNHCDKFNSKCEIEIEISTSDLIAELERRRMCHKTCAGCFHQGDGKCEDCRKIVIYTNFKEAI